MRCVLFDKTKSFRGAFSFNSKIDRSEKLISTLIENKFNFYIDQKCNKLYNIYVYACFQ